MMMNEIYWTTLIDIINIFWREIFLGYIVQFIVGANFIISLFFILSENDHFMAN